MMGVGQDITRADIEREARALIGVPFKHQNSDPATGGVDCRGLLEYLAHRLTGRPLPKVHDYRRRPPGQEFYERLSAEMDEIAVEEMGPGDVAMIHLPRDTEARHVGVLVEGLYEPMIVHAWEHVAPGRVIEEPYRGWIRKKTVRAFRFRGLTD